MNDDASRDGVSSTEWRELRDELEQLRGEVHADKSRQLPVAKSKEAGAYAASSIENRVATAATPEEAANWARVRGEMQRQDDLSADRKALRAGQLLALRARVGLSFAGVAVGAGLLAAGLPVAVGLFCIGVGLSPVAPDLVADTFKQIFGKNADE